MAFFQQGHALTIGVADYQDSALKLKKLITLADAKGVADALKDPAVAAYPPEQVHLVPGEGRQATRNGVVEAMEQLAGRVAPNDTFFFFFCGHGVLGEDGEYYLTTEDTILTTGNLVKAGTGLSRMKLLELLRAIKAQKLLVVINACFSGHIGPTLAAPEERGKPPSSILGAEVLATGEGRALITASRPTQYSYFKSENDQTYFGQALLEGLRGEGVAARGGYVGLYELYQHLYTPVRTMTSNQQDPVLTILQGVGPFPVALHEGGTLGILDPGAIQMALPEGTAVKVVERSVVQAIGRGAQAFNVQGGGRVSIDRSRKLIDLGSANTMGNVSIGDVAGRDIIKITTTTTAAAQVEDLPDLAKMIQEIRADLAKLTDAPKGKLRDADHELSEAGEAVGERDWQRISEKLESSQKILLSLGGTVAAAVQLAATVGTLLQRALGLRP